jgi:ATP-dependent DNA helicase RecG
VSNFLRKGIEITNKVRSQIQDIANNCQPSIPIELKEFKNILIVTIPEGNDKPYQCSNGFFIRMGANAQKMKRNQIVEFLQADFPKDSLKKILEKKLFAGIKS